MRSNGCVSASRLASEWHVIVRMEAGLWLSVVVMNQDQSLHLETCASSAMDRLE